MATLTHAESRRLYSWWWDSHISPKNSKWLKENLADIDIKVKAMIKLIEEDADSFARRAEMYYKKRPELMKLVEEFYRAYRALAERYDHATGALQQAHRTMAEAFPNQIPFALPDEPPGSCTPEMSQPIHANFDYGDLHKGLKQFTEMIGSGEEMIPSKANGKKGRKGLNLQDGGGNGSQFKIQQDVTQLTEENQNLKCQFTSASMRADTAEAEVRALKETISKLTFENEAVVLQNQLSLERISKMESEISNSKDESRLEDKMLAATGKLNTAEEQCHLLEKSNQFLQLELDSIKQKAKMQQEEINQHEEELKRLKSLLEDEHLQFLQAETRRLSLEKVHLQSQEEIRLLTMEIQTGTEKLKDTEQRRTGLEEELRQLKEENVSLNDQHLASALEIINLQDEVIFLKDSKVKLEDEVRLHVEDNKNIQQELSDLKEDRNDLEQNCHRLKGQVEMVSSTKESLDILVKELQTENEELKELLKKHEHEELVHLENLKCLKKTTEKNVVLENSLSDANAELEGLRDKLKALEEFCKSLCHQFYLHVFEKALLVSQVENISQGMNMNMLSEENTLLDNSLCDVNMELEGLQGKVCNLLSEKSTLVSQVEGTVQSLQNLEASYAELELKHLNLEKDRDLTLQQAIQEESQLKEEEFEAEKHKNMDSQIEIFILQRCVHDMEEQYSVLSLECQKLLEALKSAGKLISELKLKILTQDEKLTLSEKCNGKLREGIQLVLREISFSKQSWVLDGTGDDLQVQLTLHEIRGLLNSFSDIQDENQHLLLEKSVVFTFLKQFGLDVMDLTTRKNALEQEFKTRTEEFLLLQSKDLELLMMNEQSRSDVQASNQRQEVQEAEMDSLSGQLRDLQGTCNTLHSERCKMIEENLALAEMINNLSEKKEILEEEYRTILIEAITLENLYLIFRSSCAEKTSEVQLIENDLAHLRGVTYGLDEDIELLTEKLGAMEIENVCLKETAFNLGECQRLLMSLKDDFSTSTNMCKQLNSDIESGKGLLKVKDVELMQANEKLLSLRNKDTELCRNIEGLLLDINCASMVRNELESKLLCLSEEKEHICKEFGIIRHENEELNIELGRLTKEVQYLRNREEHLTIELPKTVNDVKSCEIEIAALYSDLQTTTVNCSVFEEKVLELLMACESLDMNSMVQRERLHEEVIQRTANLDKLKGKVETAETEIRGLKEELNAFSLHVPALSDDVTTLEELILSLAKHHASRRQERRDNKVVPLQHKVNSEELGEFHDEHVPSGVLELQQLQTKVKMLQKLVVDTGSLLEHEIPESSGNLEDAMKDVEVVKSKNKSASYDSGTDNKLWYGDVQNSTVNSDQYMKDIQLDHVLTSSQRGNDAGSYSSSMLENTGTNQDLDLWETTKTDRSVQMQKPRSSMLSHDTDYQEIVVVEEECHKYSSSEVAEKELSVDKLELCRNAADSHQEWNSRVIEGLPSDAQRLWALQTGMQELKRNMETSEINNTPTSFEFNTVKLQLKEAEESILQLIDINMKLTQKAENTSASSDIRSAEKSDEQNKSRRKISESARRVSEKIGMLELELHKIQYVLLKLKEAHEMKRVNSTDRRKVLLKDYIYGKMDRRKKGACWCMRPQTKDD